MYRKNTAGQFVSFAAVNATNGAALTGATISMRRCLDGTFAAGGATITEDTGLGFYKVALAQADTNGNNCQFFFTATNMVPVCINIVTTAADPTDSVRFGLTALPNAAAGANTGLPVVGTQVPNATAGAANGLLISGSNSGTTTFGALTCTGTLTVSDGIVVTRSTGNSDGVSITGSGTGYGLRVLGGNGATGGGVLFQAQSTDGTGFATVGTGSGSGTNFGANGTGAGFYASSVSGTGTYFSGGNGDGFFVSGINGNGMRLLALGASKHGLVATGGTSGTCDGIKGVAGTGGVPIRGDITGNITGNLSGNVGGNVTGSVGSVATGGIVAASFAADAIDAAAIATTAANEIRDAVWAKTLSEETGDPGATPAASSALMLPYMGLRNKRETDSSLGTDKLYNNAGTAILSATVTDTGTVFTKAKYA